MTPPTNRIFLPVLLLLAFFAGSLTRTVQAEDSPVATPAAADEAKTEVKAEVATEAEAPKPAPAAETSAGPEQTAEQKAEGASAEVKKETAAEAAPAKGVITNTTTPPATAAKEASKEAAPKKAASENPYNAKVRVAAMELAKELSDEQTARLANIRTGFGMLRAVKIVQGDVSRAASSCGKKNPEMKKDVAESLAGWKGNIGPVLEEEEKEMWKTVKSGIFPKPEKIKNYFTLIDKLAGYADSKVDKQPVTTPAACKGLIASMNRTGPEMAGLLKEIDWMALPSAKPAAKAPLNP